MKRKTEREKFEALYSGWDPTTLRCVDGGYDLHWLDGAWCGWCAAKRQAKREAQAKGCEKCGHVKWLRPRKKAKREQRSKKR